MAAALSFPAMLAVGVYMLYRKDSEEWVFFLVMLLIGPALLLAFTRPRYLYFRYFIVCFPFFYLLLGYVFAECYRSRLKGYRWIVIALMGAMLLGQGQRLVPLLQLGRGSYMNAISYISDHSPDRVIRIGSDHDFRNRMLLAFYVRFLPGRPTLEYIPEARWREEVPDWLVTHSQDPAYLPPGGLAILGVGNYRLVRDYRFSGISGWSWFVYRHEKAE
jgi:hypothetical protein